MEIEMVLELCATCGVPFAISRDLQGRLKKCHNTFYCPMGHGQSYKSQSEEEKLKKQLAETRSDVDRLVKEKYELNQEIRKLTIKKKSRKSTRAKTT